MNLISVPAYVGSPLMLQCAGILTIFIENGQISSNKNHRLEKMIEKNFITINENFK